MARVLLVDDSHLMRKMLANILVAGGHTIVAEATNGAQAVAMFHIHQPDVVTMDITMPEMDGIQAVTAIVAMYPMACIVMVSAIGQSAIMTEALNAGAKGFIVKPFSDSHVCKEVDGAFARTMASKNRYK